MTKILLYSINLSLVLLFFVFTSQIDINARTVNTSGHIRPITRVTSTYKDVNINYKLPEKKVTPIPPASGSTDWESRVMYHCGLRNLDCNTVLRIMYCESGGRSNAYNASSGASGLFQQLQIYWDARAKQYGVPGTSPFDGEANIIVSLGMMEKGMMSHWECK